MIFARGRFEPPGAGIVGEAFVDDLRSKVNKNIKLYAVNYPADTQADLGANDIGAAHPVQPEHLPEDPAGAGRIFARCGGHRHRAGRAIPVLGFKTPLPSAAPSHIAAVALFGNGTQWLGPDHGVPAGLHGPHDRVVPRVDPICNPADPDTWAGNWPDHLANAYVDSGMVNQAAKLRRRPALDRVRRSRVTAMRAASWSSGG